MDEPGRFLTVTLRGGVQHDVQRFPRAEFLANRWDYQPGEHVTILGKTGSGKTHLAYQLLGATCTPKLPGIVLVMKPRDATVARWSKSVGFRRVKSWPPPPNLWRLVGNQPDPPGYVLWPRHSFDPDKDDLMLYREFRGAILDSYKRGNRILFADEVAGLYSELRLHRELETIWMRGRSMGCGLWAASQRPAWIGNLAYSSPEHLFLHNDPTKLTIDKYKEIGGVDPNLIVATVQKLRRWEFLYIRRDGPFLCIVEP